MIDFAKLGARWVDGKVVLPQEQVPGKQVTIAHILATPDMLLYYHIGLKPSDIKSETAMGVMALRPSELSAVAADLALKTAKVKVSFIDRFDGTLFFTGKVAAVHQAMSAILAFLKRHGYTVCEITRS